jgi:hypothetical protein
MPKDTALTQVSTVGDSPGGPTTGTPAQPGHEVRVKADVRKEYVAAGRRAWWVNYAQSLDWAIDDVTRDFGVDLYERMLLDPQVASSVAALKTGILEDEVSLTSAVRDHDDDGYEQAKELVGFCEKALQNLDMTTPIDDVLWDLLDAVAVGNRVAEAVYQTERSYSGKVQIVPHTIKTKPQEATAFVVDSFGNIVGLLALIPGVSMGPIPGMVMTNPEKMPQLLPREKFVVLSFRPRNNDPRGTSVLRPAYDSWFLKEQLKGEFMAYLARFATPSLIGNTDPNSVALPIVDAQGAVVLDSAGNPIVTSPEEALLNSLLAFRNGTALVLPPEAKAEALSIPADGTIFLAAFAHLDRQIAKAITSQTLATEEGQHRSGTDSKTHQDVLHTVIRHGKKAVKRMLRRDLLSLLVRLNYGDKAIPLTPVPSLGDTESPDFATDATAVAALQSAGFVAPSQYPGLDAKLGLPPRDPAALQVQQEAAQAQHEAALRVAQQAPQADLPEQGGPRPVTGQKPAPGTPQRARADTQKNGQKQGSAA